MPRPRAPRGRVSHRVLGLHPNYPAWCAGAEAGSWSSSRRSRQGPPACRSCGFQVPQVDRSRQTWRALHSSSSAARAGRSCPAPGSPTTNGYPPGTPAGLGRSWGAQLGWANEVLPAPPLAAIRFLKGRENPQMASDGTMLHGDFRRAIPGVGARLEGELFPREAPPLRRTVRILAAYNGSGHHLRLRRLHVSCTVKRTNPFHYRVWLSDLGPASQSMITNNIILIRITHHQLLLSSLFS